MYEKIKKTHYIICMHLPAKGVCPKVWAIGGIPSGAIVLWDTEHFPEIISEFRFRQANMSLPGGWTIWI